MALESMKLPVALVHWSGPLEAEIDQRLAGIEPESLGEAIRVACRGGKRIRPLISLWFGSALGVDREAALSLACLTEWLHNAFLIHDDIQDGDTWRRDQPTLWKSHGTATALNSADWLLSAVYSEVAALAIEESVRSRLLLAVSGVHRRTIEGQQHDLAGRADPQFNLQRYDELVRSKTGRYLALGMVCIAIVRGFGPRVIDSLWQVGDQLGPAFQIQDDLLDLTPGKGRRGESGNDIREGKPSILYAHAMQSDALSGEDRQRLVEVMGLPREQTNDDHVDECVQLFEKCDSFEFARSEAMKRSQSGREIFNSIDDLATEVHEEFELICSFMTERKR